MLWDLAIGRIPIKYWITLESLPQQEIMKKVIILVIVGFIVECKQATGFEKSLKLHWELVEDVV